MKRHLTQGELIEYQFELASEAKAEKIAEHLRQCAECSEELEHLKRRFAALDLLREDVEVGQDLIRRVTERASGGVRRKVVRFRAPAWIGAAAAVFVMASLLVISLSNDKAGQRSVGRPPSEVVGEPRSVGFGERKGMVGTSRVGGEAISERPPFAPASAIELVVLPRRENVQLTIYNSTFAGTLVSEVQRGGYGGGPRGGYGRRRRPVAVNVERSGERTTRRAPVPSGDLTLVRERRNLTLKRGWNWLQFMWANTLIDPTSLSLEPLEQKDKVDVQQLVFPARLRELGRWLIRSEVSGQVPFEITYFTSGLSWRAFYMGTLSQDEAKMELKAYVRVDNQSGEDYEDAQTRLIVGQVHILEQIAGLARREHAYGRPGIREELASGMMIDALTSGDFFEYRRSERGGYGGGVGGRRDLYTELRPKEIKKEGLSEYFLYVIEGTETIPSGWSKRLLSFDKSEVPVVNLYKYEQERYGDFVVRFLSFNNDDEHKLGEIPIPGGMLKVYRTVDADGYLSYVGQSAFKYIPVDEEVELNLGAARTVTVEPTVMDFKTENYVFDDGKDIVGWDEIRTFKVEVTNTRDLGVKVEIKRNLPTEYWDIERSGEFGEYERFDLDTVKFTLLLERRSKKKFEYTVRTYHGRREESWEPGRQD